MSHCPRIPNFDKFIASREDEIVHYAELGNTVIVNGLMITPELAKRWNEYLKTYHHD